ncbi:MAG: flippase [Chloroflexaceae bacterium]|nr:flippase [Chloroflexaceae bacterium]
MPAVAIKQRKPVIRLMLNNRFRNMPRWIIGWTVRNSMITNRAAKTSQVMNRATTFVVYAFVGRYLGVAEFGVLSLGLTLMYTFQIFAVAGLKLLITREISREPERTNKYIVNGTIAVMTFSLVSFLALGLFVLAMNYSTQTSEVILLLGLALIPYALTNICEAVFQAWERMHYIAYGNVPANILKVVGAWYILDNGYSIHYLALLFIVCYVLVFSIEWWYMMKNITKLHIEFDYQFTRGMLVKTLPFLGMESVIAIWASIDAVLLSKLSDEFSLGLYNASAQLLVPAILVIENLAFSIFPLMCRKFDMGIENLKNVYEYLVEALLAIALPAAVGLSFLAGPILLLLYGGDNFSQGAVVLQLLVWILIPIAFTNALGQVLMASLQETLTLKIVVVNMIISIVLGIVFIIPLGVIGAALSTVISQGVNLLQHYFPTAKTLRGINLWNVFWKPMVATLVMAGYLFLVSNMSIWFVIPSAALVYGVCLVGILILTSGSIAQFRERYFLT